MKVRDIVVGVLIVLAVVVGGKYLLRNKEETPKITSEPEINIEDKLEDKMGISIPNDVSKVELKGAKGRGIFYPGSLIADLPEPGEGRFYEGWLKKEKEYVALGELSFEKGGWILNFSSDINLEDYTNVVVSLENILGKEPSEVVLEGSF